MLFLGIKKQCCNRGQGRLSWLSLSTLVLQRKIKDQRKIAVCLSLHGAVCVLPYTGSFKSLIGGFSTEQEAELSMFRGKIGSPVQALAWTREHCRMTEQQWIKKINRG